ncbi:MAG: type II toxin-antitoxin system VapC family toxin [Bryobacteraceae bacterium]|nr:type II toxin-antitoxin system VapC family toxin [Bryobacteraceae bacterium]
MIVLDTNVLSESFKPTPSATVMRWLGATEPSSIFTTTVTQAEILYGVESMPAGKRRSCLQEAVEAIFEIDFRDRILSFDEEAARCYARIVVARESIGRQISQFDAQIAAICRARNATLATRNIADFEKCGIALVNPWNA